MGHLVGVWDLLLHLMNSKWGGRIARDLEPSVQQNAPYGYRISAQRKQALKQHQLMLQAVRTVSGRPCDDRASLRKLQCGSVEVRNGLLHP